VLAVKVKAYSSAGRLTAAEAIHRGEAALKPIGFSADR